MFPAGKFGAGALRASPNEQVLRVEALGIVHLEDRARRLAELHVLGEARLAVGDLAGRFEKNREFLDALYHELAVMHRSGEPLPAGAEWLLDNHRVVDAQLRDLHSYLPHHCYWELPKLHDGVPRVYSLALELIAHADGLVDEETIVRAMHEIDTAMSGRITMQHYATQIPRFSPYAVMAVGCWTLALVMRFSLPWFEVLS